MKIKLAVLEKDDNYLKRISSAFNMKFADKLEVFAYTDDEEAALSALKTSKIDVFLAGEEYDIPTSRVPAGCSFAYLVDEPSLEEFRGRKVICRFQQIEMIYKRILGLYAEDFKGVFGGNPESDTTVLWFGSAGGGCGGSSSAAAAAIHFARMGKKTLYLTLDEFGDAELFFDGTGQSDMSELIYALTKNRNIILKMESIVRHDEQYGVFFFAAPTLALDINDLTEEGVLFLIQNIRKSGNYEIVVIDRKFSLNAVGRRLWMEADRVALVSDGSDTGNRQMLRACDSMKMLASQSDGYWLEKLAVIYNKMSGDAGRRAETPEAPVLGDIPFFAYATTAQLLQNMSLFSLFESLLPTV